jgi:ABC-2 type transport system ATP-binding protein
MHRKRFPIWQFALNILLVVIRALLLSARRLKDLFAELAASGTAIFLSTHDLATAESIGHRVGIIHKGRLLVEGSSSELRQIAGAPGLEAAFLSLTAEDSRVPV